jgi:hypothetical protein
LPLPSFHASVTVTAVAFADSWRSNATLTIGAASSDCGTVTSSVPGLAMVARTALPPMSVRAYSESVGDPVPGT